MMGFFLWKESFSIGNEEMDSQHKKFLGILNDIHGRAGGVADPDFIGDCLSMIKGYISEHFSEEEAYLEAIGYPAIEGHRQQHEFFKAQIADFEGSLGRPGQGSLQSLLVFLRDWFLRHIVEMDRDYAAYSRQIQLASAPV